MFWYRVQYIEPAKGYEVEKIEGLVAAGSYMAAVKQVIDYCSTDGDGIIDLYVTELNNPLDSEELMEILNEYPEEK